MAKKQFISPPARQSTRSREQYFRDVGTYALMDKQQELELAARIRSREIDVWAAVLGYSPLIAWTERLVRECVADPTSFAGVYAAAAAARKTRRVAERRRYEKACRRLGGKIRDLDRDHVALDELLARVDGAPDEIERLPARSGVFEQAVADARAAAEDAARARHQFVRANLRLAVYVASKYTGYGLAFDDLIQEGNLGLMKAVNRFDHRRGNRFSTYATWWIHHTLGRAVADTSRTVRVPVHVRDTHQRIVKTARTLSRRLGRAATEEEVAADAGISVAKLRVTKDNLRSTNISLDAPVGDDETKSRQEVFAIPEADDRTAEDEAISRSIVARLRTRLGALSEKESDIIRRRFGLDDRPPETLKQIAGDYGLSRERIRQLEAQALEKLRRFMDEQQTGPRVV